MCNINHTISSSQFVELCNTTRNTLRHYEKIKLLIPYTDKNTGFKYYNNNQVTEFMCINYLQSLGYSLSEISDIIKCGSVDYYMASINTKIENLTNEKNKIEKAVNCLSYIKSIWTLIKNLPYNTPSKINLTNDILINVIDLDKPININDASLSSLYINRLMQEKSCNTNIISIPLGFIVDKEHFIDKNNGISHIFNFYSSIPNDSNYTLLPKGDYFIYLNNKDNINSLFDTISRYIENNNIKLLSDIYFTVLFNISKDSKISINTHCLFFRI